MKILYIDESGVPELSAKTDFVILSGVLVNEEDERAFLFLAQTIKKKYGLNLDTHIHAVDIFQNTREDSFLGRTKKRKKKDLRRSFQEDFWQMIKSYDVEHYTVKVPKDAVCKELFAPKYRDHYDLWIGKIAQRGNIYAMIDRHLPMDVGVNAIYRWAAQKVRDSEKLKIVLESRSEADQFTVRNHSHVLNNSDGVGPFKDSHVIAFAKKFKKIVVSISFANKEVGFAGLEIADMIAYTCNIYFVQGRTHMAIDPELRNAVSFRGIHKTLNSAHYKELSSRDIKKYIPGLSARTKRIDRWFFPHLPTL